MAVTTTPRLGLSRWSAGSDPWPARTGWDGQNGQLEAVAAIYSEGTLAERPAAVAGVTGRFYWAKDTHRLYYSDGTGWFEQGPIGGAGPGGNLAFGSDGIEGVSSRSARSDHTHKLPALPAVSSTQAGLMPAADKAKLDAATPNPTGSVLVSRDSGAAVGAVNFFAGPDANSYAAGVDAAGPWGPTIRMGVTRDTRGTCVLQTAPTADTTVGAYPIGSSLRQNSNDTTWPTAFGLILTHRYSPRVVQEYTDGGTCARWIRTWDNINSRWNPWWGAGTWQPLNFPGGITGNYHVASFNEPTTADWMIADGVGWLRGAVATNRTTVASGDTPVALPSSAPKPKYIVYFTAQAAGAVTVNCQLQTDGTVVVKAPPTGNTGWLSVDGVRFDPAT